MEVDMNFITSVLKGIFIGMGAILPGISSGVLCVILGLYDKLVESVLGIFKNFKENFKFLFPIIIGIVFGFLLFGNILNYLFNTYESECKSIFLGFIIGGIPTLFKTANKGNKFKSSYLIYTILSFSIGIFLFMLEKNFNTWNFNSQSNYIYLLIAGISMSAGIIIPGVSSTVILMCFGIYYNYLNAISTLNLSILIPIGMGVIIGSIIFLKLIRFLLNKYPTQTYYSIIGFVIGSIFVIIPTNFSFPCILLFIVGLSISLFIEKKDVA